ncbi:MAG: hypothetical protein ACR2QT_04300 [Woeseiaceae bacterium]
MVSSAQVFIDRIHTMPEGLLPILLIIAAVIVYVLAKVVQNVRKSEQQWEQVDKTKLREWDDDD